LQQVNSFKGISNRLYVFGFKPIDLVVAFLGWVFLHGIFSSLLIDFLYTICAYFVLKKIKNRPDKYLLSLIMYFVLSHWVPVALNKEKK